MGRMTVSYRGHLLAFHGGDLDGFHSQVSFMPKERIGVIVFVIGDHDASLYNTVSYNVYERLLGLSLTPWSERTPGDPPEGRRRRTRKRGRRPARTASANTKPSHALADYAGDVSSTRPTASSRSG